MRILQVVTRSEPGGAQSIVLSLSESLCEAGHTVAIASGPEGDGLKLTMISNRGLKVWPEGFPESFFKYHDVEMMGPLLVRFAERSTVPCVSMAVDPTSDHALPATWPRTLACPRPRSPNCPASPARCCCPAAPCCCPTGPPP